MKTVKKLSIKIISFLFLLILVNPGVGAAELAGRAGQ